MIRVKQLEIVTSNAEIAAAPEKIKTKENIILEWDAKVSFYSKTKECLQNVITRMNKKLQMIEDINTVQESLLEAAPKGALQYMVETDEFKTKFLETAKSYTPDLFYSFAIKYCAERFEFNKKNVFISLVQFMP